MQDRSRVRRRLKWTGTATCGLIAATFVMGQWRGIGVLHVWNSTACSLFVDDGGAGVEWWGDSKTDGLYDGDWRLTFGRLHHRWSPSFFWMSEESRVALVPLWLLFVLAALPTLLFWRLDRRRPAPGHCPKCGYNLTGNVTGVCPECGAPTEHAA